MGFTAIILTIKQGAMFDHIRAAGDRGWYIESCKENAVAIRMANALVRKEIVRSEPMPQGYVYRVKTWKDALP
jgi:hypothetical protein